VIHMYTTLMEVRLKCVELMGIICCISLAVLELIFERGLFTRTRVNCGALLPVSMQRLLRF
jgi:hypothetical protein